MSRTAYKDGVPREGERVGLHSSENGRGEPSLLIPSIGNVLFFIGVGDTYEHLVVAASTQVFFALILFYETDGITNSEWLAASVTLLDSVLMELCVDGAVNIVFHDELSDFRGDIVSVTLLLCLYQLQVCPLVFLKAP